MSKFAPIHVYSGYSLLKSGLTDKKIINAIKNNSYYGLGLSDEYFLYGFSSFTHLCIDNKIPYILGLSIEVENNSLVVYAINEEGYLNLININLAYQKDELNLSFLKSHGQGLIGVLETNYGYFKEKFSSLEKLDTSFNKYLLEISKMFSYFYLGIEVTSKEEVKYANKVRKFADEYTYECVALPRIYYLKKDEAIVLDIVNAIDRGIHLENKSKVGQHYFMNEADYHKIYSQKEIDNTNKIIDLNKLDFLKKRGNLLRFSDKNSDILLKEMSFESLNKLGLDNDQKYIDRLNYELGIISKMGYSDYFLLVQDYVNWAKNNQILVGAGRGSSAGSLVSYLLNIIEIDPLKYDLQFERFLNPNRSTMPDIDVDFMDIKRDDVIQYMRDKYGNHRVANIVAFQTIGAKQALRDIGRVYQIPERHISLLTKSIGNDKYSLGQAYKYSEDFKKLCDSDTYFKEIVSLAGKIEGLPRQTSLHASGVILNDVDMEKVLPVTIDLNDNLITQFEAEYLEELGFLKMDFLGIRNLTTVDYCVDLINSHYPDLHLSKNNIPYNSPEIFEFIRKGQNIGLFQIETQTMKKGIKIIQPNCFEDVVALLALNRPGPMQFMVNYAKRRDGKEAINYICDDLQDILSSTYGIIVYQEQINMIATKVAGMTPGEADLFRRAISKKDKAILEASKKQFIQGCINTGHDNKVAEQIYQQIEKFANYGFNKSHSVAYAVLTCRMAWIKRHYPLEFYSAVLQTGSTSETKFSDYVSEMRNRGIKILSPNVNKSTLLYEVNSEALLLPLTSIKGINSLMCNNIIEERKNGLFTDFFNFVTRLYPYKINEAQILSLINAGALDELFNSRASMRITTKSALQYSELNYSDDGQMNLGISAIAPPSMNIDNDNPMDNLALEYETIGIMLSSNPLDYKKEELIKEGVIQISNLDKNKTNKFAGVINVIRYIKTKKYEDMAVIKVFDQSGEIEVTIFPKTFDLCKGFLVKNNIVIITGRFDRRDNSSFLADEIKALGD